MEVHCLLPLQIQIRRHFGLHFFNTCSPEIEAAYSNLDLFQLFVTEVMYNPPGGGDFEFIELKNPTDAPLDLSNIIVKINGPSSSALMVPNFMIGSL